MWSKERFSIISTTTWSTFSRLAGAAACASTRRPACQLRSARKPFNASISRSVLITLTRGSGARARLAVGVRASSDPRQRLVGDSRRWRASQPQGTSCLLYTSDAADEEDSVDLGGRRII